MPTISIIDNPHVVSFSRNPILYKVKVNPFTTNDVSLRTRIMLRVEMESEAYKNDFTTVYEGYEYPSSNGMASIDVATIIDAHLSFLVPNHNFFKIHKGKSQMKRYRVSFFTTNNNQEQSDVITSPILFAIKGGVTKEEFHKSLFFTHNMATLKQPLHFAYNDAADEINYIRLNELKYIFWLMPATMVTPIRINVTLHLDDGTNVTYAKVNQHYPLKQYEVCAIQADYVNLSIQANTPAGKNVVAYSIAAFYFNDAFPGVPQTIFRTVTFTIDRNNFYDTHALLYRNSLGGLDTQTFLGENEFAIDTKRMTVETSTLNALMGAYLVQPERYDQRTFKKEIITANTGFISIENIEKLTDLLLNKQVFQIYKNRLIPVYVNTTKANLYKNTDQLYNLAIEFEYAYENENHSRKNLTPASASCPAVEYVKFTQTKGGKLLIEWKLFEGYDKIHVQLTYNSTTYDVYFYGNSGTISYSISDPNQDPVIVTNVNCKARTVCNDELEPFSYGPYTTTVTVQVRSYIKPIAVDDVTDETFRAVGARILQLNNSPIDLVLNDIANNGYPLTLAEICDSTGAPATTSNNGATLATIGAGPVEIQYTATGGSIAIADEDYFFYKCAEMIPAFGVSGGLSDIAKVRVPMKGQTPKIWVKLINTRWEETTHKFGLLNSFEEYSIEGDYYLAFFKDVACTIPADVTSFGLTFAYRIEENVTDLNSIGLVQSYSTYLGPLQTVPLIGYSMKFLMNYMVWDWDSTNFIKRARYFKFQAADSVGNIEFINAGF